MMLFTIVSLLRERIEYKEGEESKEMDEISGNGMETNLLATTNTELRIKLTMRDMCDFICAFLCFALRSY